MRFIALTTPRRLVPGVVLFGFTLLAIACGPPPATVFQVEDVRATAIDTLAADASGVTYPAPARVHGDRAPARQVNLLHTTLDLRFDLENESVTGTASHRLTPIEDSTTSFYFHAVGMEIESVRQVGGAPRAGALNFTTQSDRLTITPQRPLMRRDTVVVEIAYTAYPMRGDTGSDPIAGRGLYFINADGEDPLRPTQIWTQGQPIDTRRWIPTWDFPNDKMTFDISLTVPENFVTGSNGELVEQTVLPGEGMRRDRWVLDSYPQPAYLAALVAGEFALVEDAYVRPDGTVVPLSYYVEPSFADQTDRIFGETAQMLAVFEAFFGVRYPWNDYKQAVVRDFTAGGMENTTLTILHEGVQADERAWLTRRMNVIDLLAHEVAHHWFGNLVTAEDWANLSVNEGFASFAEIVYREAAHGEESAQERRILHRLGYMNQARDLRRPIIWNGYENLAQVFDPHNYQKAALVIDMLRFELGDAAFRRGMQRILTDFAGESIKMDDVRRSFERESGRSLEQFFSQWFDSPGHPQLLVTQAYFGASNQYTVQVTQTQSRAREPVFHFDVDLLLDFGNGDTRIERARIASADTTLRFNVPHAPRFVRFNHGDRLLADIRVEMALEEVRNMAFESREMPARFAAIDIAGRTAANDPRPREIIIRATNDDSSIIRRRAMVNLRPLMASAGVAEAILARTEDEDALVRVDAYQNLAGLPSNRLSEDQVVSALNAGLRDRAWAVVASAVRAYARVAPSQAYAAYSAAGLLEIESWQSIVETSLLEAMNQISEPRAIDFLIERTGPGNVDAIRARAALVLGTTAARQPRVTARATSAIGPLLDDRISEVRSAAATALGRFGARAELELLRARLEIEEDDSVRASLEGAVNEIERRTQQQRMRGADPIMG